VKTCFKCKEEKSFDHFQVKGTYQDGRTRYHSWCYPCLLAYNTEKNKKWREKQGMKVIQRPKNYLSNVNLHCEMLVSLSAGKLTRPAQNMILLIGKGVNRKFYYKTQEDREDALQTGLLDAFKFWMNYDPERTKNPFAYFTEVIKRGHTKYYNDMIENTHTRLDVLYDDSDGWDKI
jgi:hypothetical protein